MGQSGSCGRAATVVPSSPEAVHPPPEGDRMATTASLADVAQRELAGLSGDLIGPGDAQYDDARQVYNAMIDRRPALIVRCATADDVAARDPVRRRRTTLPLAVRGGGHNGGGLGTVDDGVVIDLGRLRGISVDPDARTVRVGGGCTWGEVDRATHEVGWRRRAGSSARPASAASRSAAASAISRRQLRPHDRQPARGRASCSPTALRRGRAPTRTPTCSGRSAAAAATSASSPRSCSGCTRSAPSWPGRCSGRSSSRPRCCGYREFLPDGRQRPQRVLRLHVGAARAAVPGGAARPEGVRHRVVLPRLRRRRRRPR